jgi:hypothetical protein
MTGDVTALVADYLTLRHDLGYHSPGQDRYLRGFAGWLDHAGHKGPIPLTVSLEWVAATASADPCNPGRRLTTVRGILRHLAAIDGATEVPPPGCSARPVTANLRTSTPTPSSPNCCTPPPG